MMKRIKLIKVLFSIYKTSCSYFEDNPSICQPAVLFPEICQLLSSSLGISVPGDGVLVAGPAGGAEVVPGLEQGQTGGADQVLIVTAVQRTGRLTQTDWTLQLGLLLLDLSGQELQHAPTDLFNSSLRPLCKSQTVDSFLELRKGLGR